MGSPAEAADMAVSAARHAGSANSVGMPPTVAGDTHGGDAEDALPRVMALVKMVQQTVLMSAAPVQVPNLLRRAAPQVAEFPGKDAAKVTEETPTALPSQEAAADPMVPVEA